MAPRNLSTKSAAKAAGWLAMIGIAVGIVIGLLSAGALTASGVTAADLPPLATPTTEPTTVATTDAPDTEPPSTSGEPKPRLTPISGDIAPGARFSITGVLPESKDGASLRIEYQDGSSGPWEKFPVEDLTADTSGRFDTKIWTSRTGERTLRVVDPVTGQKTNEITVTIG